jgi:uroporphyrin-III C-methyltransferase/precorrin-2 dehydrogenase/sirohydrochlorin ferrochelatase
MRFLPLFIRLANRPCLVVGGGEVAARKVELLRRADAVVRITAPALCPTLQRLHEQGLVHWRRGEFDSVDLDDVIVVVAATDDTAVNATVSREADGRRLPVNVVDQPDLCSFIFPSIIDRSPVAVAVSTGGASPVLARLLRARLETLIPAGYGRLATLLEGFRETVKQRLPTGRQRRRFWERVLSGPLPEQVFAGRQERAAALLHEALDEQQTDADGSVGEVYLVGAGPGDPDLLTFRALRLMQMADVVLYDRLVSDDIMDLVRRDAERIYVGKKRDFHSVRQEEISRLMADLAKQGKRVLRLKGGDPFIFGRGGEEIEVLADEGVAFQVVPGITAASGCASYAGIPLTHRDYAHSVTFVTGHMKDGEPDLDWQHLTTARQTVVIYMGLVGLPILCRRLIEHGLSAEQPAAIIEQGTTARQRVLTGTLATLPTLVGQASIHAPTLVIVGDVVRLHDRLKWFEPTSH